MAGQSQTQTPNKNPHQLEQKCEEQGNNHDLVDIPYLPTPIVTEILSRVGIKTIFNCRLVCKSWAALISTPEFAKLHLSKSPTSCLIKPHNEKCQPQRIHLMNLECPDSLTNNLVFSPNINFPDVPLYLTNSCNGLLCLYSYSSTIFICNPILGEYITIPEPRYNTKFDPYYKLAFGFSHITNQYNVLLSSFDDNANDCAQIYRLGEESWKSIESVFYKIWQINYNAVFKGALHWIGDDSWSPFICCFDFVTEEFCAVPEPFEFNQYKSGCAARMCVGVINENLSLCDFLDLVHNQVNIWVMKHYGVKESWSKEFVITRTIYDNQINKFEPIMVNGNGEIFMMIDNEYILLHKSGGFGSESKIFGVSSTFRAFAYVPSLISLKDVTKGENLKVLGSN